MIKCNATEETLSYCTGSLPVCFFIYYSLFLNTLRTDTGNTANINNLSLIAWLNVFRTDSYQFVMQIDIELKKYFVNDFIGVCVCLCVDSFFFITFGFTSKGFACFD